MKATSEIRWTSLSYRVVASSRIIFALVTSLAFLTLYFWLHRPEIVTLLDNHLSESYFGRYHDANRIAQELFLAKDYHGAITVAATALENMDSIRKYDQLYPTKRDLLLILIGSQIVSGEAREALPYALSWSESDERDADALIAYIQVLKSLPDKNEEKLAAVTLFKTRFPGQTRWPSTVL